MRRVIEGVRAILAASGLPYGLWPFAVAMWCKSVSITRVGEDGKTPYERLREKFSPEVDEQD